MRRPLLLVGLSLMLGVVRPTFAEDAKAWSRALADEALTAQLLRLALSSIDGAYCEGWKHCAPATPEELANPQISVDEARDAINRGVISGAADVCGLDWKHLNLKPMLDFWRRNHSDRQVVLATLLHGMGTFRGRKALAETRCAEPIRKAVESELPFVGEERV